jgi:hypothetical protein
MSDTCKFIGCLGEYAIQAKQEQDCHALHWQYGNSEDQSVPESDRAIIQYCIGKGLYR